MNHRFDVMARVKIYLLYICLAMLSRMHKLFGDYFHICEIDGMFGHGGYLRYLIKMFKGLDELPSGDGVLPHPCRLG